MMPWLYLECLVHDFIFQENEGLANENESFKREISEMRTAADLSVKVGV